MDIPKGYNSIHIQFTRTFKKNDYATLKQPEWYNIPENDYLVKLKK